MGTRSTTAIKDENGKTLVTLYRQFDGYPTGHGQELANFLSARTIVDVFYGMGCLAAQLIGHLKGDQIGNVYVTNEGDSQEYNYTVYLKDHELYIRCESEYYGLLFDGLAKDFDGVAVESAKKDEEDED